MKELIEKKNAAIKRMNEIVATAKTEVRAMSADEEKEFEKLQEEVRALDATIAAEDKMRGLKTTKVPENETVEQAEERAFAAYIKSEAGLEARAGEQNLDMGNNGAIIPTTIANRIIIAVKNVCPILQRATMYNVKGILKVPVWGDANTSHNITVAYQSEFTDITADSGKFTSVDLSGYLVGALTLIGKSVVNNGAVDVVNFVINQMAKEIAAFIEGELLKGTTSKATGALSTTTVNTAASATAITADELIELQAKVPQVYQKDACFIMHPDTFTAIKKLKDGNDRYLLQDDYTSEFPYRLLGKPVFLSDNMPAIEASAKTVLYGDLSGLSVNFRENINIQVLDEKYATQHALGIVSWFEFDSKVTDNQKLAVLQQATA